MKKQMLALAFIGLVTTTATPVFGPLKGLGTRLTQKFDARMTTKWQKRADFFCNFRKTTVPAIIRELKMMREIACDLGKVAVFVSTPLVGAAVVSIYRDDFKWNRDVCLDRRENLYANHRYINGFMDDARSARHL